MNLSVSNQDVIREPSKTKIKIDFSDDESTKRIVDGDDLFSLAGAVALGVLNGTKGIIGAVAIGAINILVKNIATRWPSYARERAYNSMAKAILRDHQTFDPDELCDGKRFESYYVASIINTVSCAIILDTPMKYYARMQAVLLTAFSFSNDQISTKTQLQNLARVLFFEIMMEKFLPKGINAFDGILGNYRNYFVAYLSMVLVLKYLTQRKLGSVLTAGAIASLATKIIGFQKEASTEILSGILAIFGGLMLSEANAYDAMKVQQE